MARLVLAHKTRGIESRMHAFRPVFVCTCIVATMYNQAVTGAVAGTLDMVLPANIPSAGKGGITWGGPPWGPPWGWCPAQPGYLPLQVRARQMVLFSIAVMRKPGVIATGRQIQAGAAITMTAIASTWALQGIRAAAADRLEVPLITAPWSFDPTPLGTAQQ